MTREYRPMLFALSLLVFSVTAESSSAIENPESPGAQRESMAAQFAPDQDYTLEKAMSSPQVSCTLNWQGFFSFREANSLAGGFRLAAHQDPAAQGCPGPYPFGVTDIWWTAYFAVDVTVQVQLLLFHDTGTVSCPIPGGILHTGPTYSLNVPGVGPWVIRMSLADTVCVNAPYFAGVRIVSAIDTGIVDILIDTMAPQNCRTYRDTSLGWTDLVVADGFDNNLQLWSSGLDQSQNGCPPTNECPANVTADSDPVNATVGIEASTTISANDPDGGGALQFFLVSGPGSVDVSTGLWTYLPTCSDVPGFTVTVEASDRGYPGCPQSQVEFQVNVASPPLSLDNCAPISIHWGDTVSRQLTSTGGCLPVSFAKISGPGTLTPDGYWSFATDCGDVGDDSVKVLATDATGQEAVCTFDVSVTNPAPTCLSPVAASAPHGQLTQIPLGPAVDLDGDTLLYILVSGPAWGGVNGTNWVATRPLNDSADYTVCYNISDGCTPLTQCCFLVTESCHCECHADPECDGAVDILDVILTVNRAFRAGTSIPFCPGQVQVDGRTDVNCSGGTDVIDVVLMIDVAFRGADPATRFCEPCP